MALISRYSCGFFHVYERGIRIGFAVGFSFARQLSMLNILLKILWPVLTCIAEFLPWFVLSSLHPSLLTQPVAYFQVLPMQLPGCNPIAV